MLQGTLYIISAPSGAGKTSLVNALIKNLANIKISISHTTRPQRVGEVHGDSYYFIDLNEFNKMQAQQQFLETAQVFGNYYGTARQWVADTLANGCDVILEIDWQGAQQIRRLIAETVSIFIAPPEKHELYRRLKDRQQDSEKVIQKRLSLAYAEMLHYQEYDYVVVNKDFDLALQNMMTIINSQRLKVRQQKHLLDKLLADYQI